VSQRPEFVQDSYDRYEGLNEQNNFVYASIASQKYLLLRSRLLRDAPAGERDAQAFSSLEQNASLQTPALREKMKTILFAPKRALHCVQIGARQNLFHGSLRSRDQHRWASRPQT